MPSSPWTSAQEVVTCCVMLVGQHVATSSTRRTHVQECCHRVDWGGQLDMSTSLFPEVVPETDANPEHKILIFNCKHNITASSSSATLEQAEWNTFVTMCVSWCNKWNLGLLDNQHLFQPNPAWVVNKQLYRTLAALPIYRLQLYKLLWTVDFHHWAQHGRLASCETLSCALGTVYLNALLTTHQTMLTQHYTKICHCYFAQ